MSGCGATQAGEAGFAATDAIVALLILSTTLVLALSGVTTARRLSDVARQTTQAAQLAQGLMAEATAVPETGSTGRFSWWLSSSPIPGEDAICTRELVLRSLADHRTYRFASAGACS